MKTDYTAICEVSEEFRDITFEEYLWGLMNAFSRLFEV